MIILPEDMDVPLSRRDIHILSNVRWLLRNLSIRNSNHKEFKTVMELLKQISRGEKK